MKKISILLCAFVICASVVSCRFHNNVSITYNENGHYYKMKAYFGRNKTAKVERYMDDVLASGNMSFRNTRIDGQITLDDNSTFYIKKHRGYLYIKLDKYKNSDEAFYKIKSMCEGIKEILGQ